MKLGLMYVGDHITAITEYNEAVLRQRFQCCEERIMHEMRREEHDDKVSVSSGGKLRGGKSVSSTLQYVPDTAAVYLEPNPL